MRKLTPKGIIGLTTTAFLFFILTSLIYFNDQVEFNAVEAKWELQDQYNFVQEIPAEIEIIEIYGNTSVYDLDFVDGQFYDFTSGNPITNSDLHFTSPLIQIQNNAIIIDDITKISFISFWNNGTYIGYYHHIGAGISSFGNPIGTINSNGNISIPSNATHFALNGHKNNTNLYVYVQSYQDFLQNELKYGDTFVVIDTQINIITPTQSAIDTYQVFENIRNNASTVNPLGFMNTLVSIPSQAVGYYDAFTDFVTGGFGIFDIPDMTFSELADTWWARLPIIYDKFNERYGPLGD